MGERVCVRDPTLEESRTGYHFQEGGKPSREGQVKGMEEPQKRGLNKNKEQGQECLNSEVLKLVTLFQY